MTNLTEEKLKDFFEQLRPPLLHEALPRFFDDLAQAFAEDKKNSVPQHTEKPINIDVDALKGFFQGLEQPIQIAKQSGWLCDPWQIAGLKRDEVRNSKVLSWLLNPSGSHGFGGALLVAFLEAINARLPKEQSKYHLQISHNCRVRAEQSPDGDQSNRVDIEIDDANFYLIVEVKIDAGEQEGQLERYANQAQKRAYKRKWHIVYVTPNGRKPTTAGQHNEQVVCMSWRDVATALSRVLPKRNTTEPHAMVTALLANSFFRHISQF